MAQKPGIPKGTRDFNPEQVAKRNYIFSTIRTQFETFGFQPIETPSFENSQTLMGKYGEEGDRLIFKILESGDYLNKAESNSIEKSISVYLAIAYIFKDLYDFNVNVLSEKGKSSSIEKDFIDLKNNEGAVNFVKYKIDEWSYFLMNSQDQIVVFKKVINERIKEIVALNVDFIKSKGLDFKEKRDNTNTVNWQIKWAERHIVKEFSKSIVNDMLRFDKLKFNYFRTNISKEISNKISEKALRYDLTVPFARYVVQHQNEIEFPFKRYQMQPVWRADRPQKGRFREFYQCDADVVGSNSLWQDVEFVQLYDCVFSALNLNGVTIKVNNRKLLSGIAEVIGASDKLIDFTVALDKLDKIGEAKVKEEMLNKGISQVGIEKLHPLFTLSGDFGSQIEPLKSILSTSAEGMKGIEELEFINAAIATLGLKTANLQLDVTLARGLNYYTGAIFEVSAPEGVNMGSIGGGGRYDDLTGIFGLKNVSGVGISFGLDRIYLVLEELGLFPETITKTTDVLFINFGNEEALFSLKAISALRQNMINAELYPDATKMKKQMNYANRRQIPFVVLVGDEELKNNTYTLKNMASGEQAKLSLDQLITKFNSS